MLGGARPWLFAGVMICQFALFEAGLRLEGGSEAAPAFQKLFMTDSVVGYRLKPGVRTRYKTKSFDTEIAINSSGTRGEEIGPKQPNEKRIVVLGDSLVLSVQVALEQTFCKRLETLLNADARLAPYHYRVINAGVQGYGPVQEALFYEHVAAAFDADLVVLALFVGNDAMEAADSARAIAPGGSGNPPLSAARIRQDVVTWVRRTVRRSMVLQIARMRVLQVTGRFGKSSAPPLDRALGAYLPNPPADFAKGLDVTRECVMRITGQAASRGAKTAVVLVPARFQVSDEDYGYLEEAAHLNGTTLIRDAATERFKQALEGLPVPVMDGLPPLFNAPRRSELFFDDTVHLTPRGHRVFAEALARFLVESHLVLAPGPQPALVGAVR